MKTKSQDYLDLLKALFYIDRDKNLFQKMVQAGPCRELIDIKRKKKVVVSFSYGYS